MTHREARFWGVHMKERCSAVTQGCRVARSHAKAKRQSSCLPAYPSGVLQEHKTQFIHPDFQAWQIACIHSMEVHQCLLRKRKGWLSKCLTCKLCLLGFIKGVHSYKCAYALEDIYFLLLLMIFYERVWGKTHYLTVSYFPLLNRTRLFCLLSLSDLSSAWQLVAQVLVAI